jgi:hypothetical protein
VRGTNGAEGLKGDGHSEFFLVTSVCGIVELMDCLLS